MKSSLTMFAAVIPLSRGLPCYSSLRAATIWRPLFSQFPMRIERISEGENELWERFRITKEFGFLCPSPLTELPAKYRPWMEACDSMVNLVAEGSVREYLDKLPEVEVDDLETIEELRLAHLLLLTMTSGYLWSKGPESVPGIMPRQISIPLYKISKLLSVPPVVSHSTCDLYNWTKIDEDKEFTAENLNVIAFKFFDIRGADWFFVNTQQIEKDFAPCIYSIADVCLKLEADSCLENEQLSNCCRLIQISLADALATLKRMPDHLKPSDFYHKVRPFLWGYNEGAIKKSGVIFEGLEHLGAFSYPGASAAQSSTIQIVDTFLGIEHSGSSKLFLGEQRQYMPLEHRELLNFVAKNRPNFEKFSDEIRNLWTFTKKCVYEFRSEHIKTVTQFILTQKPKTESATGTGGTSFVEFLKEVRNDCAK